MIRNVSIHVSKNRALASQGEAIDAKGPADACTRFFLHSQEALVQLEGNRNSKIENVEKSPVLSLT